MIPKVNVLHDHVSQETALVQHDYPYGRLRTDRRVWLEFVANRGFRFVTQTRNPKVEGEHWNAPHKSTYQFWSILTLDLNPGPTQNHVHTMGFNYWGPDPSTHVHFHLSSAFDQLTHKQRREYSFLLERNRTRGNKVGWERWAEKTKLMTENRSENGVFPTADQMRELGQYVTDYEYEALAAQIAAGFDPFK